MLVQAGAGHSHMDTTAPTPLEAMAGQRSDNAMPAPATDDVFEQGRASPASAVCYLDLESEALHEALEASRQCHTPPQSVPCDSATATADESDKTPRSDMPPAAAAAGASQLPDASESNYFSPRPIRPYVSRLPASTPASARPSPTASLDASSVSVCSTPALPQERRPSIHRDDSSASTTTVATIRAHSAEPGTAYPPPTRSKLEGPYYPNQSYAALQYPRYFPGSEHKPARGSRMSGARHSHFQSFSGTSITTSGLSDHRRSFMDSGSRTAGNSPASSPGLFSPRTPPLGVPQQSEDGLYSSPYLHHMHRQAPKETHKADLDVDPVSGRKIINQYEIIDELGRGVHGKVKLGRNLETGQTVAIKIVKRYVKPKRLNRDDGSREEKIKKEIAILKKARHPNIVGLLEVIDDPALKRVYIILEHVELGEVRWRTEGAREICLIEWRRYQREAQGMAQDEAAIKEDLRILERAHEKIRQERVAELRERARLMRRDRRTGDGTDDSHGWSLEHGGESDQESIGSNRTSRASTISRERAPSRSTLAEPWARTGHDEPNMETAVRAETAAPACQPFDADAWSGLEGTQYGPYDDRGRTPSIAGSSSSGLTEEAEDVPEHFRYVPLLTLQTALEIFRDTVLGLEYLHFQGVIHRDIKPANLLQTREHRIKISDFGVSYLGRAKSPSDDDDLSESDPLGPEEPEEELAKTVGTPAFYAPELCREGFQVSKQLDIWALGVTLYCLVYGRVPFFNPNQHQLLENIFSDDVVIPRFRLKATIEQSGSRPSSHGRMYHTMTTDRRDPHALEYEEVGHDLRDLLEKLLTKDPKQRISIREIKRHPWVLQGLDNYGAWVEETDPERKSQGKRIEVSHEDVERAVVPISWSDRVRSGMRKTIDTVLGIGRRGGSRKRAQSNVTSPDTLQPMSTRSSSSTISQEGRRPSLAMTTSILEALTRSRAESEHPLSQSVSASPEAKEQVKFFEPSSRTASPSHMAESREHPAPLAALTRPIVPERAHSATSSNSSLRTVRPSDVSFGPTSSPKPSVYPPPGLPGTPTTLEPGSSSTFGNLLGGVPRLVSNMRSREKLLKSKRPADPTRAKTEWRGETVDDPHSEPSLALSIASAAGHVDTPEIPDVSPRARRGTLSKHADAADHSDRLERSVSRQSSVSSNASSYLQRRLGRKTHSELGPVPSHEEGSVLQPHPTETHAEMVRRAQEEHIRKRVAEENENRKRERSLSLQAQQQEESSSSPAPCPPSPDDLAMFQRRKVEDYLNHGQHTSGDGSFGALAAQSRELGSSSSEDHFSKSTSDPSIPSVSASSSVGPDECLQMRMAHRDPGHQPPKGTATRDFGWEEQPDYEADTDHTAESDLPLESDFDNSDDDFLVMGKKKPAQRSSASISNAQLARSDVAEARRSHISGRRRSARSGSNGTVKKVEIPGTHEPEDTADAA